jgi:hypothetical protein
VCGLRKKIDSKRNCSKLKIRPKVIRARKKRPKVKDVFNLRFSG